jgi:hypothetical protein
MSYGFKKSGEHRAPMSINKDNAISRGRYVSNIEYHKTDKAEYLVVEVIDKSGNYARRSYFEPKIGGGYIKTEEDLKKEQDKFNRVMKNLTTVFLGSSYETGEVASFEGFCKKVIADIGKSYNNKEVRAKIVYDGKNRPTLPNFPIMFEDPAVVSDDDTKMRITQWDKVELTVVEMDEDPVPTTNVKSSYDDIPFK